MANDYGQFDQGKGQKYAPKAVKKARVVQDAGPVDVSSDVRDESVEDQLRSQAKAYRSRVLRAGAPVKK